MELKIELAGNTAVCGVSGELDDCTAKEAREKLDYLLLRREIKNMVFDFNAVTFMDSAGIGLIMGRYKTVRERGGKVYIICANENIRKILKMSGVLKLLVDTTDTQKAVACAACPSDI